MLQALEALQNELGENPTVDSARQRLGGRGESGPGVGRAVLVPAPLGTRKVGVVVYADDESWDVWLGGGRVRRSKPEECRALPGELEEELAALAADARLFASLREGESVRWQHADGLIHEGVLVEKCRYGALVVAGGDRVVAVGFRQLWPSPAGP